MSYVLPSAELVAGAAGLRATAVAGAESVSPFLKPAVRGVKAGFASPYSRLLFCAVTVRCATVTVRCPVTYVKTSLSPTPCEHTTPYIPPAPPPAAAAAAAQAAHLAPPATPALSSSPPSPTPNGRSA